MALSQNAKGIMTLIGGFIVHLGCGTVYSFGLLNPFMISYLYLYDNRLLPDDGFFLMPLCILFEKAFVIVGGLIESKAGPRVALLIGFFLIAVSYLFLYFSTNMTINYLAMAIFGIGIGINVSL